MERRFVTRNEKSYKRWKRRKCNCVIWPKEYQNILVGVKETRTRIERDEEEMKRHEPLCKLCRKVTDDPFVHYNSEYTGIEERGMVQWVNTLCTHGDLSLSLSFQFILTIWMGQIQILCPSLSVSLEQLHYHPPHHPWFDPQPLVLCRSKAGRLHSPSSNVTKSALTLFSFHSLFLFPTLITQICKCVCSITMWSIPFNLPNRKIFVLFSSWEPKSYLVQNSLLKHKFVFKTVLSLEIVAMN